jgi:hypothetical protein
MLCTPHPYPSGNPINKTEKGRACSTYGRQEKCIEGYGGKTEVKRPPGRPLLKRQNNIKIIF